TVLAPFTIYISIAIVLLAGPVIDRIQWELLNETDPTHKLPEWRDVWLAFVTSVPLFIASAIAFFSVCGSAGGLFVALSDPLFGNQGSPRYALMAVFAGLTLVLSIYLGLLIPFLLWRAKGRYDLNCSDEQQAE
ncbi:MAG: hypothetical protein AAGF97_16455, partial [Planctomycetota bacterium]